MKSARGIVAALAALGCAQAAVGRGDDGELRAPDLSMDLNRQPEAIAAPGKPARVPFGAEHSRWWTVGGGIANNFLDATDFNVRGAYSYFLVKDVEFAAELNGWYFHQDGPDTGGINPAMVFRWHFYDDGQWTVFGDLGIGLLVSGNEVPAGGTVFNFTPRLGAGFTRELDAETGTRLQVGLRWHHISNARISGASSNPSRDALMVYGGIQFPF